MATYPDYKQGRDSTYEEDSGENFDYATDGTPRARSFYADTQYKITLIHPLLTDSEKTALLSFWDANKSIYNTLTNTYDGSQYSVLFAGIPKLKPLSGGRWKATVTLLGTKL